MCAKIIRKSIFIDNDIKMPPIPGEDTAVQYFILTIAKKVAVIERPLYYYYFNRSGSQNNSHRRYTEYMVQMLTYGWYLFKKAGLFEKYKELLFIESLANISQWYPRIKDDAVYSEKWLADCSRAINSCFGDIMMRSPLRGAKRIVGYGALGKSAARLLPLLKDSPLYPTELWDVRGDGVDVFKPDFHSLSENDVLLCFPVGNIEKELKECFKKLNCLTLYASDIDLWFGYWKIFGSLIE